jgi:hypothetical protein
MAAEVGLATVAGAGQGMEAAEVQAMVVLAVQRSCKSSGK